MKKCICSSPNLKLKNTHYKQLNIDVSLLKDDEGYGIIIFEGCSAIACFEINYCPICGKNLKGAITWE